jgi:predicted transcriptional regulator
MEERGVVTSVMEGNPVGPPRRRFSLAKSVTITMDLAPNLFIERATALETNRSRAKSTQEAERLRRRVQSAREEVDERERLSQIDAILNEIDERVDGLEEERVQLLSTRNQAMQEAARIVNRLEEPDTRRVLFHVLDQHEREVDRISEALELREVTVKEILAEIEREFFG